MNDWQELERGYYVAVVYSNGSAGAIYYRDDEVKIPELTPEPEPDIPVQVPSEVLRKETAIEPEPAVPVPKPDPPRPATTDVPDDLMITAVVTEFE